MISYVLALFSLILIVPIVYFLPLGFTKKGKWWIIGAALLTSVCGLLTQRLFAWWQTVLLMLLFLIIFTYIFIKKSPEMMFEAEEEMDEEDYDWEMATAQQVTQRNSTWDIKSEKLPAAAEVKEVEPVLTAEKANDEEDIIIPAVSVEEEFMKSDFSAKEDVNNSAVADEIIIGELEDAEEIPAMEVLTSPTENAVAEHSAESFSYMEELEMLMNSDENETQQENKQSKTAAEFADFDMSLLEDADQAAASVEDDQDAVTPAANDESLKEQEVDDFVINPDLLEREEIDTAAEDLLPDILAHKEPLLELSTEKISEEENIKEESMEEVDVIEDEVTVKDNRVAHQVINNTLMQLDLMKNSLSREEYEAILLKCLTETLPLHEYFALSNLLIEHYVQHNESSKLRSLFVQLQTKYQLEPIILEQLSFMEKNYLNN
ncbi:MULTISPECIES: hypothetical protein [unclassified Niallia]|uniref:hypothetical protein n=1 Tax=unclassified Niallia TaxID=2837522 RepID=UPI001EDC2858|nr:MULTISPECIES: hypothetical protein [unclassified Niallia]MDL0436262.1 hypothetical protein [Niallia sp. SS-2023]UPO86744.1 hypothetical protein L8T27_014250 [Niallia sp. Man26]